MPFGDIFFWVVFGFIAGAVARLIHPGRDPGGCIITILLGIGGAVVGGYIGTMLGWGRATDFSWRSFALAVSGALLILIVYRAAMGRRRR